MVKDGVVTGVALDNEEVVGARYVIAAPGRSGAAWIREEARRLAIPSIPSPVDIGVRVEVPAPVLAPLTEAAYEAKLIYYSRTFDDKVRTFCMNPYGEVVLEDLDGLVTVNGHSYTSRKTENSNFAILVSSTFTEPFDDPISYGQYIARLANLLGQGALVQRLGDLQVGRRTYLRPPGTLPYPAHAQKCHPRGSKLRPPLPLPERHPGNVRGSGCPGSRNQPSAHLTLWGGSEVLLPPPETKPGPGNPYSQPVYNWGWRRHNPGFDPGLSQRPDRSPSYSR